MKKTLLAAAMVVTASVGHAQAAKTTSPYEIYGMIDTSIQSYSTGGQRLTRHNDNGYNVSRLGFRGSEDLGKGLRALFNLEGQLNPSIGSIGGTSPATNEIFNREAWVGLSGRFGEIRTGRTDVSMASNLDAFSTFRAHWNVTPINGTPLEIGIQQKNTIRYTTPRVAGLQAMVGYASGNNHGTNTDADASQTGASVTYIAGPFKAAVGYHKNNASTKAGERDMQGISAAYDLGFAQISALHIRGDNSTTGSVSSRASTAGLTLPLPQAMAVSVHYHTTTAGEHASNNNGHGAIFGVTKDLSKRTRLYGGYALVYNQANSAMFMNNVTTAPSAAGLDTKATFVGVNHTF